MLTIRGPLLDVIEASREAVTLRELAQDSLRALQEALGCSLGSFTHSPEDGAIEILGCTDPAILREYRRDWFDSDPINHAVRRYGVSWIIPASSLPEWNAMQRHPLYAEWAPSKNARFLLHLRLSEARYLEAGAVNVFLCRPKGEPDFGHRDLLALSHVIPDLETAVRRCGRIAAMNTDSPVLESLLDEAEGRPRLALRSGGQIVWASKAARRLLAGHLGRGRSLPASLVEKVRRHACGNAGSAELHFVTVSGARLTARLHTARAGTGELFVIIGLHSPAGMLPEDFRTRFLLTDAEVRVLSCLAEGLSNAQIAERRSVSVATIRTHVAHILAKMGVRSRFQAGVMARAAM